MASIINNFQVLLNGARLPPHGSVPPGLMTEARATPEAANSEVPWEDLKRRVRGRPKGAGGILNSNSQGRLFPFICLLILLRHLGRVPGRGVGGGQGVPENKASFQGNSGKEKCPSSSEVRKGTWGEAIHAFLSCNEIFPNIVFPELLNAKP